MDVSIMGAGQAGTHIAQALSRESYNVTLADTVGASRHPRRRGNGKPRGGCRPRSELLHYSRFREVAALAVHSAGTA